MRTSSRHTIGGISRVLCQLGKAKLLDVRPYEKADESRVVAIWKACGLVVPWNDPVKDIARKLCHSPDSFLVGLCQGEIVATVMFGYDGHRGSVNYLAVTPSHQNRGLARDLMRVVVARLACHECPKINLMIRQSNLQAEQFYQVNGYGQEPVVVMSKRLVTDD